MGGWVGGTTKSGEMFAAASIYLFLHPIITATCYYRGGEFSCVFILTITFTLQLNS